jgi:hypothetical protein
MLRNERFQPGDLLDVPRGDLEEMQCYLIGPTNQFRKFALQDNGVGIDSAANNGTFTGGTFFGSDDLGLWKYFVLAQDVNNANLDLTNCATTQHLALTLLFF